VAVVLLARSDHDRRVVRLRVRQCADRVAEPGRRVQVHERRPTCRHRVALGHADDGRLLQCEHVVQVVRAGERVDQGQFGTSGISE